MGCCCCKMGFVTGMGLPACLPCQYFFEQKSKKFTLSVKTNIFLHIIQYAYANVIFFFAQWFTFISHLFQKRAEFFLNLTYFWFSFMWALHRNTFLISIYKIFLQMFVVLSDIFHVVFRIYFRSAYATTSNSFGLSERKAGSVDGQALTMPIQEGLTRPLWSQAAFILSLS